MVPNSERPIMETDPPKRSPWSTVWISLLIYALAALGIGAKLDLESSATDLAGYIEATGWIRALVRWTGMGMGFGGFLFLIVAALAGVGALFYLAFRGRFPSGPKFLLTVTWCAFLPLVFLGIAQSPMAKAKSVQGEARTSSRESQSGPAEDEELHQAIEQWNQRNRNLVTLKMGILFHTNHFIPLLRHSQKRLACDVQIANKSEDQISGILCEFLVWIPNGSTNAEVLRERAFINARVFRNTAPNFHAVNDFGESRLAAALKDAGTNASWGFNFLGAVPSDLYPTEHRIGPHIYETFKVDTIWTRTPQ